jgi:hypothetical protein
MRTVLLRRRKMRITRILIYKNSSASLKGLRVKLKERRRAQREELSRKS